MPGGDDTYLWEIKDKFTDIRVEIYGRKITIYRKKKNNQRYSNSLSILLQFKFWRISFQFFFFFLNLCSLKVFQSLSVSSMKMFTEEETSTYCTMYIPRRADNYS